MTALTAVDYERRRTWALTIAAELLRKDGAAAPFHDEGKERCRAGGFRFCRQSSTWYSFATDRGGLSATSLIRFLRPDYTREDASAWLASFLGANPGVGQLEAEDEEWTPTRREAVAALCRHRLDTGEKVLPPGSPGATYRASRGLPEAASEGMLWIANARPGEGALIMPLIAFDCITGTLETYINALGRKSLALPNRRRLDLEPAPGAVMEIAAASPGTIDIRVDVITCEGWENEESITLVKSPAWRVLALPGINTMKHLPSVLKPEERRVIAFQRLPSEGASRPQASGGRHRCPDRCRQASQGDPAFGAGRRHSILQSEGLGEKELSRLTACAGSAALSFEGKVAELPKLPETEYMKTRRKIARTHEVPAGCLDREVAKRRRKPSKTDYLSASKMPAAWVEGVVTNPPYWYAQRFAERALYVALLLRTDFLMDAEGPRVLARSQRADARRLPPAAPADDAPGGLDG